MNVARPENGASIVAATSYDPEHPPECMIDSNPRSFWISTGLFPQEFILHLGSSYSVSQVTMLCTNVRQLEVERCEGPTPVSWTNMFSTELSDTDGDLQTEKTHVPMLNATYLKVKILSGYDDFVSVQAVEVEASRSR
mmetsp:Transcript_14894/g.47477  ORF Transcript_14894/g.47477 Transcript_14894/m.47477 type:complete len:138 (+) Transcript_14894:51-464(+)